MAHRNRWALQVVPGSADENLLKPGTFSVQWVTADKRRQWVKWGECNMPPARQCCLAARGLWQCVSGL